jgi:hypothetical protein
MRGLPSDFGGIDFWNVYYGDGFGEAFSLL